MPSKQEFQFAVFSGRYEHGLDEKGRIVLPARFRERLGKSAVLTHGLDDCLEIYPLKDWMAYMESHVLPLDPLNSSARALLRRQTASAQEVEIDKQGRILVPPHLREETGLGDQAILVGVWNKIEIWAPERWAAQEHRGGDVVKELDAVRTLESSSIRRDG